MNESSMPLSGGWLEMMRNDGRKLSKRERTRRHLIEAAIAVITARGVEAASVQEIAEVAGVANGTFYNHFPAKEAVLEAIAVWLCDAYSARVAASYADVAEGAERMAIGNRRYVELAVENPSWAALLLEILPAAPVLRQTLRAYTLADLKLGLRQKRFHVPDQEIALGMIRGTVAETMRMVIAGRPARGLGVATATMVLRGLGMAFDEAAAVARRPLPPLDAPLPALAARPAAARIRR